MQKSQQWIIDKQGNLGNSERPVEVNDAQKAIRPWWNKEGLINYNATYKSTRYAPGHQMKEKCYHPSSDLNKFYDNVAPVVKTLPAKAGFAGSTPTLGKSSEVENGNPLHYSYLENSMDRGVWWATV